MVRPRRGARCGMCWWDEGSGGGGRGRCRLPRSGLLWGGVFTDPDPAARRHAVRLLRRHCAAERVVPYFAASGAFMVTPVYDLSEEDLREALRRISRAVAATAAELRTTRIIPGMAGAAAPHVAGPQRAHL